MMIAAALAERDRKAALRAGLAALLALLAMLVCPGGAPSIHYLPQMHRQWLTAAASLTIATLAGLVPGRPSRAGGRLAQTLPGFVLPVLAGYW